MMQQGERLNCFFVDFESIANYVFFKRFYLDVSSWIVRILRELYNDSSRLVLFDSHRVLNRVMLSPMLFTRMMNDLHDELGELYVWKTITFADNIKYYDVISRDITKNGQ